MTEKVENYIKNIVSELKITSTVKVVQDGEHGPYFKGNTDNFLYKAGRNAIKHAYNCEPDMIRMGGSIPISFSFVDVSKKDLIFLTMGRCDDGAHSQNEKLNLENYVNGTKMMASFLMEL